MTKNLIKMLAAVGEDVDLEEIYNELGTLLGKNNGKTDDLKAPSLKEYFGMTAPSPDDMESMLEGAGFTVNTETRHKTVYDTYGNIGVVNYDRRSSIYSSKCILNDAREER